MGDTSDIERVTNMGLRTIYSTCWYLDYISYGMDWDKYYKCEQIGKHNLSEDSVKYKQYLQNFKHSKDKVSDCQNIPYETDLCTCQGHFLS